MQSGGDIDNYRYSAPEIQWPEDHDQDKILITRESDVYGMGMVVYEASSYHSVSSNPRVKSHIDLLGFDGEHAVLQMERYHYAAEDTGGGNASTTFRG